MSITLDVNAFLNNSDICSQSGCNGGGGGCGGGVTGAAGVIVNGDIDVDISMEKEMETNGNIFDEIEHLLKFNKNLEFPEPTKKDDHTKVKKTEEPNVKDTFSLDFLTSHTDDFLLASDTQSLLGEDPLLFSVEHDRLQPLTSRFMVPGIYKRIEGVDRIDSIKKQLPASNVYVTNLEKTGRIITGAEFNRLYVMENNVAENPGPKVSPTEPLNSDVDGVNVAAPALKENDNAEKKVLAEMVSQDSDALNRLACDILKLSSRDHIVIDRKRNEIVKTQFGTNQKTIYRLRNSEMLGLKPPELNKINSKSKGLTANVKSKLRRSKKDHKNKETLKNSPPSIKIFNNSTQPGEQVSNECSTASNTLNQKRTRSGRLVRTPQISKHTIPVMPEHSPASPNESLTDILMDLKDASYQCSKVVLNETEPPKSTASESLPPIDNTFLSPPKRKVPPEAICPTCHKIFLGRRLKRHFAQHPDHMKVPMSNTNDNNQTTRNINQQYEAVLSNSTQTFNSYGEDMSLFRFLVTKLQKSQQLNEDQKADLFLSELNDLVEQLHLRSSRLIRNTSGLHFVHPRCAKLLGIPEGQYALDLTAIEAPLEPEIHNNTHTSTSSLANHMNSRSLDYTNLSITLDDTLTDEAAQKLNLSAGGKLLPPSEESLLRAVDDLVQTDISKMQTTATCVNDTSRPSGSNKSSSVVANLLPPHIDHVTDNAVEAVNMKETSPNMVNASENPLLDLSVDFFQFNN